MDEKWNFNNILKSSFIKLEFFSKIAISDIIISLCIALLIGIVIFKIYKKTFCGAVYNHTYNISLVIMTVLTTLIIMTVSSNVVLSLGMVGALSIVRYRTALKDPMDIMYMFWAICAGIATGARIYSVSLIGTLFVGTCIVVLTKLKFSTCSYLLLVRYDQSASEEVDEELRELKCIIKSKIANGREIELTAEVKISDKEDTNFINNFAKLEGVKQASLVNYNGDYVI